MCLNIMFHPHVFAMFVRKQVGRCVRMKMTVSLTCETYIRQPKDGQDLTRDDITCKIIYCSTSQY